MKLHLKSNDIYTHYISIDFDHNTILKASNGSINFETQIDCDWNLKWYLSHQHEICTKDEFDTYYKEQVELLNSITLCYQN